MHRSLKRNLVIGLAALALAAFAGGAYAATQNSGPSTRQAFLNDVAKRLHVTPQQLNDALSGAAVDQLQAAVKAGELTQAQADALAQRLKNGQFPIGPLGPVGPFGPGAFGPGGQIGPTGPIGPIGPNGKVIPRVVPFGPGGRLAIPGLRPFAIPAPGFRFGGGFGALPAAASYLGLTNAQLLQELSSGKSLAQIATAKGKSVSDLEQAMTTAEKKTLDELVTAKVLTQAQENEVLKHWSSNLSARVNSKGLAVPFRAFKPGSRPPFGPGFAVPAPQNAKPGALPAAPAVPMPVA